MIEAVSTVIAGLYVVQGSLGIAEQRVYTDAQRARAPLLTTVHLAVAVLAVGIGVVGAVWIRLRGLPSPWYFTALNCGLALTLFVQIWLYREIGVSHSPLFDRVSAHLN